MILANRIDTVCYPNMLKMGSVVRASRAEEVVGVVVVAEVGLFRVEKCWIGEGCDKIRRRRRRRSEEEWVREEEN